ncbi:MAG: hypothetical protein WAZ23_02410 [Gemmiger qucibialis]
MGNTAQFPPCGLSTAPAAAAPRSPYRHLELCGIALIFPCRQCGGVPSFCLLLFAQFGGNTKISV